MESNGEKLYTPQNSQAFTDRTYVNTIYGFDNRETAVFITDPKTSGANILTKPALLAFLDLFNSLARSVPKPYILHFFFFVPDRSPGGRGLQGPQNRLGCDPSDPPFILPPKAATHKVIRINI